MPPRSMLVAAAVVASNALANHVVLVPRQRDTSCPDQETRDNGAVANYIATIGYFSDHDCTTMLYDFCSYLTEDVVADPPGSYGCEAAVVPEMTPYFAQILDSSILKTGRVLRTVRACVEMSVGGDAPGLPVYPKGGSNLEKKVKKCDGASCSGFTIDSQQPSESQSVQVSSIVDCTNSADSGCMITMGEEHTESVTTSYSVTAGGGIEGLFEVSTTFGMEYTSSETTSIQEGFSISQGQKGYLSAYYATTLFKGTSPVVTQATLSSLERHWS